MTAPARGDLINMDFDNAVGHEEADYRRAIVLSPVAYNARVGLAVVCAITNQEKGYPFEVKLPAGLKVTGVVLSDQVRTIDWAERKVRIEDHVPDEFIEQIQTKLSKLIL